MTKDEEYDLRKAFTFENFKKLLYVAGEGLQIGECDAGDLLYCDVLKNVSEVCETIDKEANQFLGIKDI